MFSRSNQVGTLEDDSSLGLSEENGKPATETSEETLVTILS